MTRMTDAQENQRGALEDCLALLSDTDVRLRLIEIRTRFLRERYAEQTNTTAINAELDGLRRNTSIIRAELTRLHDLGEQNDWHLEDFLSGVKGSDQP